MTVGDDDPSDHNGSKDCRGDGLGIQMFGDCSPKITAEGKHEQGVGIWKSAYKGDSAGPVRMRDRQAQFQSGDRLEKQRHDQDAPDPSRDEEEIDRTADPKTPQRTVGKTFPATTRDEGP